MKAWANIKMHWSKFLIALLAIILVGSYAFTGKRVQDDSKIISYVADPEKQNIRFYWKDDGAKIFRSISGLKGWLESKNETLVFAMNGGMYKPDNSPQGLYVQDQVTLATLDTGSGKGNFYLKPNGVFCITTTKQACICKTADYPAIKDVNFATQSGPLLVINGEINPAFKKGSSNLNVRNGVGILPGNKILFAMSKEPVNFFDFATYFKSKGCKDALYLDGFVSRTYLPEKGWKQTDGDFGVIVGVTAP